MKFEIQDMTCGHCSGRITAAIQGIDSQAQVDVDLAAHQIQVNSQLSVTQVASAIEQAGYTPKIIS